MAWRTIAFIGYQHSVNPYNENPSAHGGVCLLQARKLRGKLQGRYVNTNGCHEEVGEPFALSEEKLEHWRSLERCSR